VDLEAIIVDYPVIYLTILYTGAACPSLVWYPDMEEEHDMFQGFKNFILKGNVVDMAVGVVIGVAFGSVVTAFVNSLVMPLIGAFGGIPDFSAISFTVNNSKFMVGEFVNALTSFLTISAVVYFAMVAPMNKIMEKMKSGKSVDPTDKLCPECLSMIPIKAKRCKFCTSTVK
jgi:large conductance mechanosensitive channel